MELTWNDVNIRVPANKTEGKVKVACPQCTHQRQKHKKDPSLSVDLKEKIWKCHHCGWTGTLKMPVKKEKEYKVPVINNTPLSDKFLKWFEEERKITRNTLLRWKITQDERPMSNSEGKRVPVICYNYYKPDLTPFNIKYRSDGKGFGLFGGAELLLYGLHLLPDSNRYNNQKTLTITEGEMDALAWSQAGIDGTVSVPNGAPKPSNGSKPNLEYIDNSWAYLEDVEKFILALDDDIPGIHLRGELSRRFGKEKCFYVVYPEGCKDANDVLIKHGEGKLKEMHENAIPFPIKNVARVIDLREDVDKLYHQGIEEGKKLGFGEYDTLLTFSDAPQLTTTTGIPTHGKSLWNEFKLCRLMCMYNRKVAMFTPEHYPIALHLQRLAKIIVGKPFFKGNGVRMTNKELNEVMEFLYDHVIYIQPEDDSLSLDELLDTAKGLVRRYGISDLLIDPWNEIDHDYSGLSETQYAERALRKLKAFKNKYEVNISLVAHPTKMRKNEQTNKHYKPTLYDISGTAHFYNKSDNGEVVYRDFEYNTTEVIVEKVKFSHLGRKGSCIFSYNTLNDRFTPDGDQPDNGNWLRRFVLKSEQSGKDDLMESLSEDMFPEGNFRKIPAEESFSNFESEGIGDSEGELPDQWDSNPDPEDETVPF